MTQQERQILAEQEMLFSLTPDPEALQDVIDFAEEREETVLLIGNKIFYAGPSKDTDE